MEELENGLYEQSELHIFRPVALLAVCGLRVHLLSGAGRNWLRGEGRHRGEGGGWSNRS